MKAVGVIEFGGPDSLQVVEIPHPKPEPGEVVIRVLAATVNPTDTYISTGARAEMLQRDPPPYVPGMDAAGILEEIGEGVSTDLRVGDRVMAVVVPKGSHGAYSERIALPAESVVRTPAGTSHAEASTLPMNGLTARLALDLLELPPGATIGVTGSAGALGGYVIQLAKADGLRVVADAAPADEALVRRLGADVVVARGDDVAERMRAAVPDGVDGLVDGALLDQLVVPAVRDGGRIATVRGFTGTEERGITFHPVWVRTYAREHEKLDRLRQQVEAGQITLRVARTYPAAQAGEAHKVLGAGGTRGRLVLEF
ncbi:MAG TPA: NADP-dependent oxidoreductase [Acidimicrobiales bacterium]|nr:NADP-dependent oxidoreductase [Acidimicrobiales bacterium]